MKLTDRQGKVAVVIDRPMRCDNCLLCPCLTQTMSVQCPPGVVGGHVEQALSLLKPTYIIKDREEVERYLIEGPTSLCSCFMACCHCCASRDIIFRIVDIRTERQVGSISKKWSGVLKEVLTKADRFSVDFPPDIGEISLSLYIRLFIPLLFRCWIEGDIVREEVKVRIKQI